MTHRMMRNVSGVPKRHPLTGQVIMPGQSYMEPEDAKATELLDMTEKPALVQTVADPEATQKARAKQRKKVGEDE